MNPRLEAFDVLRRVEAARAFAGILLEEREGRFADPRDAALLHELVLGVLRRRAALDHAIARVSSRPLGEVDLEVLIALRLGAYALLHLDRVPDFAAVTTSVDLVRAAGRKAAAGFANGVLRQIARRGAALLPPEPARGDADALALYASHPAWWTRRLVQRVGWDRARAIVEADNLPAATVLRVRHGIDPRLDGIESRPGTFAPGALHVVSGRPTATPGFAAGTFWMQDEGSQLVPALAGVGAGARVLDACAAPGGKTLALADAVGETGFVVAADRHAGRLRRLARNVARCRLGNVAAVAADMTAPPLRAGFDVVLVDAPCSGTGTMRRHPEIRWRLRLEDLPAIAERQQRLLAAAAGLVRPGGAIVYAVCSMEPEEGASVVETFLASHPAFRRADARPFLPEPARALVGEEGYLHTSPDLDGMDGFFAARIESIADRRVAP
ncbi:MAG TPA: transcription antitermination factor NusB [Candidatus Polarisedimenticolaceae bacterium]